MGLGFHHHWDDPPFEPPPPPPLTARQRKMKEKAAKEKAILDAMPLLVPDDGVRAATMFLARRLARQVVDEGGSPKIVAFSRADKSILQPHGSTLTAIETPVGSLRVVWDHYAPRGMVMVCERAEQITCPTCGHAITEPPQKWAFGRVGS